MKHSEHSYITNLEKLEYFFLCDTQRGIKLHTNNSVYMHVTHHRKYIRQVHWKLWLVLWWLGVVRIEKLWIRKYHHCNMLVPGIILRLHNVTHPCSLFLPRFHCIWFVYKYIGENFLFMFWMKLKDDWVYLQISFIFFPVYVLKCTRTFSYYPRKHFNGKQTRLERNIVHRNSCIFITIVTFINKSV